jgi:hypothetical protein
LVVVVVFVRFVLMALIYARFSPKGYVSGAVCVAANFANDWHREGPAQLEGIGA